MKSVDKLWIEKMRVEYEYRVKRYMIVTVKYKGRVWTYVEHKNEEWGLGMNVV